MTDRRMTYAEALAPIAPVIGHTTLMAGALGDQDAARSVSLTDPHTAPLPTLEQARERFASLEQAMADARSDAAYWGYAGEASYWRAVVMIAEAFEGRETLPYVAPPDNENRVVMDAMYYIEQYGEQVKAAAAAAT